MGIKIIKNLGLASALSLINEKLPIRQTGVFLDTQIRFIGLLQ